MTYKCGVVGIIGKTNAGKSTLLNAILNKKVSITSATSQTTRNLVYGLYEGADSQILFVDTPGFVKPQNALEKNIDKEIFNIFNGIDLLLFLFPADWDIRPDDYKILERIKKLAPEIPIILIVSKIDLLKRVELIPKLVKFDELHNWTEVIPLSAQNSDNLKTLLDIIKKYLAEHNTKIYEPEQYNREQLMIKEIIREKIINAVYSEVPRMVAVQLEHIEWGKRKVIIEAAIVVNKDSQKSIIIGHDGEQIKNIGVEARKELEVILKKSVFLSLNVKLKKNWINNGETVRELIF